MKMRALMLSAASLALAIVTVYAADEINLENVKCVLNPKGGAKAATGVDYKGGQVFFCCGNCQNKFKSDPAKHAVRANHQLVATQQAQQKSCPLTGRALNPAQKVELAGVEVQFCCPGCKGKVADLEGNEQLTAVFGAKPFAKGFETPEDKDDE